MTGSFRATAADPAPHSGEGGPALRREWGLKDLILLNVVAITGLRWWVTAAGGYGWAALPLWVLANLCFFVPSALAVIDLTTRYPEEGGIYVWTKRAFGDLHGFICGWCYWTNNLFYFPTLLMFSLGNLLYVFGPRYAYLEKSNLFMIGGSLAVFWIATGANLLGLRQGRWLNTLGGLGTWIPAMLLIGAGAWALARTDPATPIEAAAFVPVLRLGTVAFFAQICFAFSGFELGSVLSGEIVNPRRNIPLSILIAGSIITVIYILGTAALLVALPQGQIGLLSGVGHAVGAVQGKMGLAFLAGACALLIAMGGLGQTSAWIAGASRIPFLAGLDNYLPSSFGRLHPRRAVPHVAILWMGGVSSLIIVMSLTGGAVTDAYLVLANFTIIIYFIPYLYLFACLVRLATGPPPPGSIPVPGGRRGILLVSAVGFITTLVASIFALVPPDETVSTWRYEAEVLGGCGLLIGFGWLLYRRGRTRAR
jgi:amino acid transporter